MKNPIGKLEKLRNYSTATLSCLNKKEKHFGHYSKRFELFLRENRSRIDQIWWLL